MDEVFLNPTISKIKRVIMILFDSNLKICYSKSIAFLPVGVQVIYILFNKLINEVCNDEKNRRKNFLFLN